MSGRTLCKVIKISVAIVEKIEGRYTDSDECPFAVSVKREIPIFTSDGSND